MLPVTSRLKDAVWSVRRRYGMESDIDRIIPYLAFDGHFTNEDQLNKLLVTYPKRTPEDFKAATIILIQDTVRAYWSYRQTQKGYHRILKGIVKNTGFQLVLKPEFRPKKKT